MAKGKEIIQATNPWNYAESVNVSKKLVGLHGKVSLDLARELHAAKLALSNPGFRTDRTSTQMGRGLQNPQTFEGFLEDIGLPKSTANRWLTLYVPEEDKLLTPDEFKARKILEFESWIKKLDPKFPDWRPEGWPPGCEQYYQGKLREKFLLDLSRREKFEQLELFNAAYMKNLADSIVSYTTEDVIRFSEVSKKIEPIAYPGVPVRDQAKAFMVVEKVLERFAAADRKSVARAIAEMTALYAQEED